MQANERADGTGRPATNWREIGWITAALAGFFVADRWFDVPVVISAPIAFLGAIVYGYFAHERSARRRAELTEAAAAAWAEVEAAGQSLREAELGGAPAALVATRGEAYAAALDRSAIVAKLLADHAALHGEGARRGRAWRLGR